MKPITTFEIVANREGIAWALVWRAWNGGHDYRRAVYDPGVVQRIARRLAAVRAKKRGLRPHPGAQAEFMGIINLDHGGKAPEDLIKPEGRLRRLCRWVGLGRTEEAPKAGKCERGLPTSCQHKFSNVGPEFGHSIPGITVEDAAEALRELAKAARKARGAST